MSFKTKILISSKMKKMKKRIMFALFVLMIAGSALTGCKSQELCPAYGANQHQTEEESRLPNS